ncbi:MAG: caspase family protein [Arcticibacter sp.]
MNRLTFVLVSVCIVFFNSNIGLSQKRVALVVGNSNYKADPLKNTINDAVLMESTLKSLNFDVKFYKNLNKVSFRNAIDEFIKSARDTSVEMALFYYAGHAYEFDSKNYLLPIDTSIISVPDPTEFIEIQYDLIGRYNDYSSKTPLIVILDACRNNPFYKTRGSGFGIKHIESPRGSLIAYSAESGKTAPDGKGENSLYTRVLSDLMKSPGISLDDVFKKTRQNVNKIDPNQLPGFYNNMIGDLYLIPPKYKSPSEVKVMYEEFIASVNNRKYHLALALGDTIKNYLIQDTTIEGKITYIDFLTAFAYCHWGAATEDNFSSNDTTWTDVENYGNYLINQSRVISKEYYDKGYDQFRYYYYRSIINQIETDINWLDFEDRRFSYNDAIVYLNEIRNYFMQQFGENHEYTLLSNYLYASYIMDSNPVEAIDILYPISIKLPISVAAPGISFLWSYNINSDISRKYIDAYDYFITYLDSVSNLDTVKVKKIISAIEFSNITASYVNTSSFLDSSFYANVIISQFNQFRNLSSRYFGSESIYENLEDINRFIEKSANYLTHNDNRLKLSANLNSGFYYFKRYEITNDTTDLSNSFDSFVKSINLSKSANDYNNYFKALVETMENFMLLYVSQDDSVKYQYYLNHENKLFYYYDQLSSEWPKIISAAKNDSLFVMDEQINKFIDIGQGIIDVVSKNITDGYDLSYLDKCLDIVSASPSPLFGYASSRWLEIIQNKFDIKFYNTDHQVSDGHIYLSLEYLNQYLIFNYTELQNDTALFGKYNKYNLLHSIHATINKSVNYFENGNLIEVLKTLLEHDASDIVQLESIDKYKSLCFAFKISKYYNEYIYKSLVQDNAFNIPQIDLSPFILYLDNKLKCDAPFDIYDYNSLEVVLLLFKTGDFAKYDGSIKEVWKKCFSKKWFFTNPSNLDLLDEYIWYFTYEKSNKNIKDFRNGLDLAQSFVNNILSNKSIIDSCDDKSLKYKLYYQYLRMFGFTIEKSFGSSTKDHAEFQKECFLWLSQIGEELPTNSTEYISNYEIISTLLFDHYLQYEKYDKAFAVINSLIKAVRLDSISFSNSELIKSWLLHAMYCSQLSESNDSLVYYGKDYNKYFDSYEKFNYHLNALKSDSCTIEYLVIDYVLPFDCYPAIEFDRNGNGLVDSDLDVRYYIDDKFKLSKEKLNSQSYFVGEFQYQLGFKQYEKSRLEFLDGDNTSTLFYDRSDSLETSSYFSYLNLGDSIKWTMHIPLNELVISKQNNIKFIAVSACKEEVNSTTYRQFRKSTFPKSAIYSGFKEPIVLESHSLDY